MSANNGATTPADVVRRFFQAANAGRIDDARPLLAEDIVVHTPVRGIGPGREGFETFLGVYLNAFPQQWTEIHQVVSEGDRVAVLHTHHATHGGEFAGIAPTGRRVSVGGLELFRVTGGQIAEMWHFDDLFSLIQALAPEKLAVAGSTA